jgi:hypothetical protein
MQCIAYIWNSAHCEENNFLLCLSPLDSVEGEVPTETFPNQYELSQRLADMGLCPRCIIGHLYNLKNERDSTWYNIEVSQRAFDGFGGRQR